MSSRKGARSLKQMTQDSIVHSIILKSVSADVLIELPTHLAVGVMKRVTEVLQWTHRAQMAGSAALLKQKQCRLRIVEGQLATVSRIFKGVWLVLTGAEHAIGFDTRRCDYRIGWERNETNTRASRMVCVSSVGNNPPDIFAKDSIKTWGMENWIVSTPPSRIYRFPDSAADYMVGQTLVDGSTGRRVTDPFVDGN